MKVIFGLGNPGREYDATRHNVGWWMVDHLADKWGFEKWRRDGESMTASGVVGLKKVRLVKPQTYMNLSGSALKPFLRREGFNAANDLLVIIDEVAVTLGEYRLKPHGSAGGHNGLKSIQAHLKSEAYPRLRIGIKPVDEQRQIGDLADYVLHAMPKDERAVIQSMFPRLVSAIELWIAEGTEKAVSTMGR